MNKRSESLAYIMGVPSHKTGILLKDKKKRGLNLETPSFFI